jgi:hypothetical protein
MSIEKPFSNSSKKEVLPKTPVNADLDLESGPDEPREIRVLKSNMFHARRTIRGEYVFEHSIEDLKKSLAAAEESGQDISALKAEAEELITQLPIAELNNILGRSEQFLNQQDIGMAMLWHGDAERRIDEWEQKGAIAGDKLEELKERDRRLYAALYKPHESGKVIDFLSIRQGRTEPLSDQERSALEREKKDLAADVKRTFSELKERYTEQAAEVLELQKKADSVLGTNKADLSLQICRGNRLKSICWT